MTWTRLGRQRPSQARARALTGWPCVAAAIIACGCGRQPTGGPVPVKRLVEEFTAAVSDFQEEISREEEPPASEDLFAGLGEIEARLGSLQEAAPELQADLEPVEETLRETQKGLGPPIDLGRIREGVAKLKEQAAGLRARAGLRRRSRRPVRISSPALGKSRRGWEA